MPEKEGSMRFSAHETGAVNYIGKTIEDGFQE